MIIENPPKWRKVSVIIAGAVVISAGLFLSFRHFGKSSSSLFGNQKKIDYVIPGVPYIGAYNHTGKYGGLNSTTSQTVASAMDYWYPGENNYGDINKFFVGIANDNNLVSSQDISNIFTKDGKYSARVEHLQLDELKKYINADARTPLIAFLNLDASQPIDVQYTPVALLIGIKESEQKLVFHNPWLGNNFEMSFDEFNKQTNQIRPNWRNNFLVVQPVDLENKLNEVKSRNFSDYPPRTAIMQNAEDLFKNYAIGWGARLGGQTDRIIEYFLKVRNDPNYEEYFPPAFKVYLTAYLAEAYFQKKDMDNAAKYVAESISLDHDLDKSFNDWQGYELSGNAGGHFGEITIPYRVQGDINLAIGNFQKAKESYTQALVIKPTNSLASAGLAAVEVALKKK